MLYATLSQILSRDKKNSTTIYIKAQISLLTLFESTWTAETVIMIIINTKPLYCHKTMAEYGHLLTRRFIAPHFYTRSKELHLLFENPGQLHDNPKSFEQIMRDSSLSGDLMCWVFSMKQRFLQNGMRCFKCRTCKRWLTQFLSSFFTKNMKQ